MASSLSFEQLKVTINSSPENALSRKDVEHQFKLLREHISSLDIKTVTQVGYCKQVAPDPRGPPKEESEMEDVHVPLPDFAIKCSCQLVAPDPRGPPYKKFEVFDLPVPEFGRFSSERKAYKNIFEKINKFI
uniref:Uncharacterized protein n=1 Tax=Meloidogyne enterolobii TaxID=390850 RepID=A0A6V7WST5_MELEN|nr:unnamed protein product [Meloidogyne enterolobii]